MVVCMKRKSLFFWGIILCMAAMCACGKEEAVADSAECDEIYYEDYEGYETEDGYDEYYGDEYYSYEGGYDAALAYEYATEYGNYDQAYGYDQGYGYDQSYDQYSAMGSVGGQQVAYDPNSGVAVVSANLPAGWTMSANVNWNNVSMRFPGLAEITFTSPDGAVTMQSYTSQDFVESHGTAGIQFEHIDRVDQAFYTIYLHYMNASQYLDYFYENVWGVNHQPIGELPVDQNVTAEVQQLAVQMNNSLANEFSAVAATGAQVSNDGYEGTVCKRIDQLTDSSGASFVAEGFTQSVMSQISTSSYNTQQTLKYWTVPSVFVVYAANQESIEHYRQDLDQIFDSWMLTDEFNYLEQQYSYQISNSIAQGKTQQNIAMTQQQAQSMMNGYDSSNGYSGYDAYDAYDAGGYYSSDDWANDWSNYIYDQNEYTNSYGETFNVGTEFDSVYQNGNEYYFGPQGSSPYGWDELTPN